MMISLLRRALSLPLALGHARRMVAIVAAVTLVASGCGSGPDLAAAVGNVDGMTATQATDVGVTPADVAGDDIEGAWTTSDGPAAAADAIEAAQKADERTDDAGGDVFLLYKSGTLWVKPVETGSAVIYYADNDKAYNRHSVILLRSSRWGSRVNTYRSSSSSSSGSGNGFRGGGSSSGK